MLTFLEIGAVIATALTLGELFVRWSNEQTFWATLRAIAEVRQQHGLD